MAGISDANRDEARASGPGHSHAAHGRHTRRADASGSGGSANAANIPDDAGNPNDGDMPRLDADAFAAPLTRDGSPVAPGAHRMAAVRSARRRPTAARTGLHISRSSARAVAAARTRFVALAAAAIALILVLALAIAAPRLALPSHAPAADAPIKATATQPYRKTLNRAAAPTGDPGRIVIGVNGSPTTIVLKGERYVEPGAHAMDPGEGALTARITTSGTVDTNKPGDYRVQYTVTNAGGQLAHAERTVRVVESMERQSGGIPVLMYHYVYADDAPPAELNSNFIAASALEEQLRYLTGNGFYFPSWREVRAFLDGTHSLPAKSVVLTFDDGEGGFFGVGAPLLAKYRVPATSFDITADPGVVQRMRDMATPYLEYQSHSHDMHRAGGTIGHGGRISAMSRAQIVEDLKTSQTLTGAGEAFAYPFGDTTPEAQEAVREAGVLCAFTTRYGWAKVGADPTALPRVRIQGNGTLETFIAAIQ